MKYRKFPDILRNLTRCRFDADKEAAHAEADELLLEALKAAGRMCEAERNIIAAAYELVQPKWYA